MSHDHWARFFQSKFPRLELWRNILFDESVMEFGSFPVLGILLASHWLKSSMCRKRSFKACGADQRVRSFLKSLFLAAGIIYFY
jgi:hypothetical protein